MEKERNKGAHKDETKMKNKNKINTTFYPFFII